MNILSKTLSLITNLYMLPALVSLLLPITCIANTPTNKPQNIVLIMADDLGLGDIAHYRRTYLNKKALAKTPQIDQLAAQGMWFTDAHSPTALCSPSRYSVMSGNSTYRSYAPWGVWGSFRQSPITATDTTIARVAKKAGYTTGFIGKWHLGGDFYIKGKTDIYRGNDHSKQELNVDLKQWIDGGPKSIGFDYDFTLPTGVQGPLYLAYENSSWYPLDKFSKIIHLNEQTAIDKKFVSDKGPGMGDSAWDARKINRLLANKARNFIEKNAGKQPFLLNYWSPAVHISHTPPKTLDNQPIAGSTPSHHLDMIRVLDKEIEVIVKALKATHQFENTLIILTSDNGGLYDKKAQQAGHYSAGNWRGSKNLPYEGGHRVPFIAVWPKHISAGSENNVLVNGTDLVSTIAALGHVTLKNNQAMDSWSLAPTLLGEKFEPRHTLMSQAGSRNELIYRENNWKLIIQSDHTLQRKKPIALFNLKDNPKEIETKNLINTPKYKKRISEMSNRYWKARNSGVRTAPPLPLSN